MLYLRIPIQYGLLIIAFSFALLVGCKNKIAPNSVSKIEMDLSSFGVESDNYPSVHAVINLTKDSSSCKKSYYNHQYKHSVYSLSNSDIRQIHEILKNADLEKLKSKYTVNESDQPRSTIAFYTNRKKIVIEDYGLKGDYPLQELYKIVYKL